MRLKLLSFLLLFVGAWGFGQIAFYNFQNIDSPVGVDANISASNVTISEGAIAYQAGNDDGGNTIGNSGNWNQNNFAISGKYIQFSITPNLGFEIDFTQIGLRFGRTTAGPTRVTVQYSLDGFDTAGTTILDNASVSSTATNNLDSFSITTGLPLNVSGTLTIRIWGHNASSTGNLRFNNFRVFGNVNILSDPTITLTPNNISGLNYVVGNGPSTEQSVSVSGINLTNNLILNAPAGFEISATSGGVFGNNLTLIPTAGSVTSTIYIKLVGNLGVGNYFGNLTANSQGAITRSTALSGNVRVFSVPCLNESFSSPTFPPLGWISTNASRSENTSDFISDPAAAVFVPFNGNLVTNQLEFPVSLSFFLGRSNNTAPKTFNIRVSTTGQTGTFTTVATFDHSNVPSASYNEYTVDLSAYRTEPSVWIRFEKVSSTTSPWRLDDIRVFCSPCTTPTIAATTNVSSGIIGTIITVNGSDFNANTEVTFNGVQANIINQTATQLQVEIPNDATSGDLIIFTPAPTIICPQSIPFEIISSQGNCQTNISGDDLIIYEIFDEDSSSSSFGAGGMVTLYNPTLSPINLSNYRVYRAGTFGVTDFFVWHSPSGILNPGGIYRMKVNGSNCLNYAEPSDATMAFGFNDDDGFELRKFNSSTNSYLTIDQVVTPNYVGYYFQRDLTQPMPSNTYNISDWTLTNIVDSCPSGTVGLAPAFIGGLPEITSVSTDANTCNEASITINAIEGYNETSPPADARQLNFQWFYFDGISGDWTEISTGGDFTILNTIDNSAGTGVSTLEIANTSTKENYQYYCRVREDDNSCFVATEAIRIEAAQTIWDGNTWSNGVPNANTVAIIDGNYDTNNGGIQGSFTACNLIINIGTVNIADGDYIEVYNSVSIESTAASPRLVVQPQGAFVQVNDNGTVTGNARIGKLTAPMDLWYEYTYWSSPVSNANVGTTLFQSNANRRFWFNAQNYRDSFRENNNDGVFVAGQDDIDDDGNDWTLAIGVDILVPGRGYAATLSPIAFIGGAGSQYLFNFDGVMNNGIITVPIYRNDDELNDNNWNFIGNPYPSAIRADLFLATNTALLNQNAGALGGAIFLWSQNTDASATTNGNENQNFAQADYAIINGSGNTAGGDGLTPNNFIPSGQGFFVAMANSATATNIGGNIWEANVVFNNSMRVTGNNDQFFRAPNVIQPDKLWLNLTSDNGVFNQVLVAYLEGATNEDDGMYFDAPRNLSTGTYASLYSTINNSEKRFAIQGKDPNSLRTDEIISLGFANSIAVPTVFKISIAQLEGDFMSNNTVYIKDNLLNLTHDLTRSEYHFTAEVGEFNQRFEIVFNRENLSIGDQVLNSNDLAIIELPNGEVQFIVSQQHQIKEVTIVDLMGRVVYQLQGNHHIETYDLSQLSKAAYIAKVTLANGQTLHKKAVKRF